jgi:hypothetical protein
VVGQVVIEDDIGAFQALPAANRDKARVAGTRADEIDERFAHKKTFSTSYRDKQDGQDEFLESLGVIFPAACRVDVIDYPRDTPLLAAGWFIPDYPVHPC